MSAEEISIISGVILTLFFSYVPRVNVKFAAIKAEYKQLIMLGLLFLVSAGAFGLACWGKGAYFGIEIVCSEAGAAELIRSFVFAIVANQGVYKISPQTRAVKEAKMK